MWRGESIEDVYGWLLFCTRRREVRRQRCMGCSLQLVVPVVAEVVSAYLRSVRPVYRLP